MLYSSRSALQQSIGFTTVDQVESVRLNRSGLKMGYSSDVSDKEWEIIEPLLPHKKKTRPPVWTCAANSRAAYFTNSKMVVIGLTYPEIYRHTRQYFGITRIGVRKVHSI
jgi:hypothetical protein